MSLIFSPSRWLSKLARRNKAVSAGRRRRREEHLHNAVAEVLESRMMLTAVYHLAYNNGPAETTAGVSIPSITVEVQDSNNSLVAASHAVVTLSVGTGPGGARRLFSVTAVNGVA